MALFASASVACSPTVTNVLLKIDEAFDVLERPRVDAACPAERMLNG